MWYIAIHLANGDEIFTGKGPLMVNGLSRIPELVKYDTVAEACEDIKGIFETIRTIYPKERINEISIRDKNR